MAKYTDSLIKKGIVDKMTGAYKEGDGVDAVVKTLESGGFLGQGVEMTDMLKQQVEAIFKEMLEGYLDKLATAVAEAVTEEHSMWQKKQKVMVMLDSPNVLVNPGQATSGGPVAQTTVSPGTGSVISPTSTGQPGIALPE